MYSYQEQRPRLFTEEAQEHFIKVRDNALHLLDQAGAFKCLRPFKGVSVSDSFLMLAMIDRLVEIGDIREVTSLNECGQDRVFVAAGK